MSMLSKNTVKSVNGGVDYVYDEKAVGDLSALYSLIGAIIGEGVAVASYYAKATKENTRGGITYDKAMNNNDDIDG